MNDQLRFHTKRIKDNVARINRLYTEMLSDPDFRPYMDELNVLRASKDWVAEYKAARPDLDDKYWRGRTLRMGFSGWYETIEGPRLGLTKDQAKVVLDCLAFFHPGEGCMTAAHYRQLEREGAAWTLRMPELWQRLIDIYGEEAAGTDDLSRPSTDRG